MSDELILPQKETAERYRGLPEKEFGDALAIMFITLETMSNRQRWIFRKHAKGYCKQIKTQYPNGRPYKDIVYEIAAAAVKAKIIIPKGEANAPQTK